MRQIEVKLHDALRDPCVAYDDGTTTHSGVAPLFPFDSAMLLLEFHSAAGARASYDQLADTFSFEFDDDPETLDQATGETHLINGKPVTLYRIGYQNAWAWDFLDA